MTWWLIVFAVVWLLLDCHILKPWFGIRRPKGHRGRWFS